MQACALDAEAHTGVAATCVRQPGSLDRWPQNDTVPQLGTLSSRSGCDVGVDGGLLGADQQKQQVPGSGRAAALQWNVQEDTPTLSRPNRTSVWMVRSCASSRMMTL